MVNRVTEDEVKKIINTSFTDLSPFISTANLIVNDKLTNKGLSNAILYKIELFLSAHLIDLLGDRLKSESLGDASNTYDLATGYNLLSTFYGQTAISLDSSGTLKDDGKNNIIFKSSCK